MSVLATNTSDEQFAEIANKIEELAAQPDWEYDDIAITTKQSGSAVTDNIEAFECTGIPTESTIVTGFGDDPAIRELLAAVRYLADNEDDGPEHGPELDTDRSDRVSETESLEDAIRWWATDSGLKERIAERAASLDARAQFGNVRRALRMAEFLEETRSGNMRSAIQLRTDGTLEDREMWDEHINWFLEYGERLHEVLGDRPQRL